MVNEYTNSYIPFSAYPDVLSVEQLRAALGIGRATAYKMIRNNQIPSIRIGSVIKIPKQALINYVTAFENENLCYNYDCNGQVNQAVRKEIS